MPDRLDDPAVVAREYASEERMLRRRLDFWADFRAPNPDDVTLAALGETSPRRVLEMGPGLGEFAARLRDELGAEVVAVDVSPRLVELVRARGIDARVGDVQQLGFGDGSFDAAVANRVLYHVPDLTARVGRRDVRGEVVFTTREALLGCLGAFVELAGEDLATRLPDVPIPFRARVANAVFVAETA